MDIVKTIDGEEATLAIKGWLDTEAAPGLHAAVSGLGEGVEKLVLDMAGVEYISSSGVREVVAAYKAMKGAMVVKNTPSGVFSIFKTIGVDKKIKFE